MTDFFIRLFAIIRKELMAVLKDPAGRAILIGPILMQSLLFGYGATYDLTLVPYAVLDKSHSASAARLLARIDGTGYFQRVATLESMPQAENTINTQEALLVIQINPELEAQLRSGAQAPIQLLLDARNSTTANSAASYVASVVDAFNTEQAHIAGGAPALLSIETRSWFNPNLQTRWNFMPALIASLSMLQTMLLAALSVAREREQGTFDQLLVTPLSPIEIMIGKAAPPIMIGLVQSTLVLLVTRFWFEIPMAGNVLTLYIALVTFLIAGVGVGLSISAMSINMQQAMLYTFVLLMPMMLLSGLATPLATMPKILQIATLANPLRFGIDLVRRIYLEGVDLSAQTSDLLPLLLIAALTLPAAAWLFRNRLV